MVQSIDDKLQPVPYRAMCHLDARGTLVIPDAAPDLISENLLALPLELDPKWMMFKQRQEGLKAFKIIDTYVGLFSSSDLLSLKHFASLNLKQGFVYSLQDLSAWLEARLGNTELLMLSMAGETEEPPAKPEITRLDVNLDQCFRLLKYWQKDDIFKTYSALQQTY
jgi:hypothetical protein